jgi:anti-sigma B factor antagonist
MHVYFFGDGEDVLVVQADASLNTDAVKSAVENVETLISGGLRNVIVDCAKLDHMNSAGLGTLIRLRQRMKQHDGDVKICGVKGMMHEVLKITRLTRLFEVYPDVQQAVSSFA